MLHNLCQRLPISGGGQIPGIVASNYLETWPSQEAIDEVDSAESPVVEID